MKAKFEALKRSHETGAGGYATACDLIDPAPHSTCTCGADDHNARVDALAAEVLSLLQPGDAAGMVEELEREWLNHCGERECTAVACRGGLAFRAAVEIRRLGAVVKAVEALAVKWDAESDTDWHGNELRAALGSAK